jgi:hypothetical protein
MLRRPRSPVLAAALFALAVASAVLAGGGPPPVEPGDLLGSTGSVGASLIDVDPATGAGTFRFPLGSLGPVTEIEFRSDGVLFGSTGGGTSNIIAVDPDTGAETLVGQHAFGSVNALEFVDDVLYGAYFAPPNQEAFGRGFGGVPTFLVTVDQTDGSLTTIGQMGFSPVRGLGYDPTTGTTYGVGTAPPPPGPEGQPPDVLFTVDLATGTTTPVGSTGLFLGGMELGPDGILYGGESAPPPGAQEGFDARLVAIDPATGSSTPVGFTGFSAVSGLTFAPGGAPSALEIPALSQLGLGLLAALLAAAGFLALRRR